MLATSFYLILAILLEVAGTTSMKFSVGFTKLGPSILIFVFYLISFICLTLSLKRIAISVAYAVWAGLGTSLITLIGIFFFHEPMTLIKFASLFLIIVGVMGLRLG